MYDVYAAQQPLEEGEEKHIISVFVADESGIINRVAGVFARRGVPWLELPSLPVDSNQGFLVPLSRQAGPLGLDWQNFLQLNARVHHSAMCPAACCFGADGPSLPYMSSASAQFRRIEWKYTHVLQGPTLSP